MKKHLKLPCSSKRNVPLSRYSTFGIGGPATTLVEVTSLQQLQEIFRFCSTHQLPFLVIGKGSNTLFPDEGFDGIALVIKIGGYEVQGTEVTVGAGYSFSLLGQKTARAGLSGLEFAAGIPATIGGALFMNAGIGPEETCDCLKSVTYVTELGDVLALSRKELSFSYRTSSFKEMKGAIAQATFSLKPSSNAKEKVKVLLEKRMCTQPYRDKSCGCVFRNPPEGPGAGALIDQCGLKGATVGGAEVSTVHANFIVNKQGATARDVLTLADHMRRVVKEKTGIELERELHYL